MKTAALTIALAAEEAAGLQTLRGLVERGFRPVIVFTTPPAGAAWASAFSLAASLGITTLPATMVREEQLAARLRQEGVDVLLNVHSLYVIHAAVLEAPRIGSFNLHPGPLPRYAGLNAPSWALLEGEREHGVTVHWIAPRIDAGPIAYQKTFPLTEEDTGLSVSKRCVEEGLPLIYTLVEEASRDPSAIPRLEQDLRTRRYHGREVPHGGSLSWSRTAREICAHIRAADYHPFRSPWGAPRTLREGKPLGVIKVARTRLRAEEPPGTVLEGTAPAVQVACADELLEVSLVEVEGRAVHAAQALRPGERLLDPQPA